MSSYKLRFLFHTYDLIIRYLNTSWTDLDDPNYLLVDNLIALIWAVVEIVYYYYYSDVKTVKIMRKTYQEKLGQPINLQLISKYRARIPRKLELILYRRYLYETLNPDTDLTDVIMVQVWDIEQYFNFNPDLTYDIIDTYTETADNETVRKLDLNIISLMSQKLETSENELDPGLKFFLTILKV